MKINTRKLFLSRSSRPELFYNSQENSCARVCFLNKVAGLRAATLLKRDSGPGAFL